MKGCGCVIFKKRENVENHRKVLFYELAMMFLVKCT